MKRLALLLVPLCLAAGCAGSALRPDDAQQQEVQALKTRIVELQREAAMSQVELAQLRQQMAELEARNGGAPRPAMPSTTLRPAPAPNHPMSPPKSAAAVEPPKTAPRPAAPAPVTPARAAAPAPGPARARRARAGSPGPPRRARAPGHPAGRAAADRGGGHRAPRDRTAAAAAARSHLLAQAGGSGPGGGPEDAIGTASRSAAGAAEDVERAGPAAGG